MFNFCQLALNVTITASALVLPYMFPNSIHSSYFITPFSDFESNLFSHLKNKTFQCCDEVSRNMHRNWSIN